MLKYVCCLSVTFFSLWNTSQICMSFLYRGHVNPLCIVPANSLLLMAALYFKIWLYHNWTLTIDIWGFFFSFFALKVNRAVKFFAYVQVFPLVGFLGVELLNEIVAHRNRHFPQQCMKWAILCIFANIRQYSSFPLLWSLVKFVFL